MTQILTVKFPGSNRPVEYDSADHAPKPGDWLVVEAEKGPALARVHDESKPFEGPPRKFPRVLRRATDGDLVANEKVRDQEKLAFFHAKQAITRRNLPMKLISVESVFDGSKTVFYFTSEERVDFRDLVRELAQRFRTRIEMMQIGVRDAARKLGGYDVCGRELCCSKFLTGFEPVTIKMAKDQNLAMNPSKVSGVCGRLKCCLRFEHEVYTSFSRGLPKVGKRCETSDGRAGRVNRHDPIQGVVLVRLEGTDEILPFPPEEIRRITPRNDEAKRAGEAHQWTPVAMEQPAPAAEEELVESGDDDVVGADEDLSKLED